MSGKNKISQPLAEVKRALFYGVDFALFEASDAPNVSSRASTLSKTNDPLAMQTPRSIRKALVT